MPKLQIVLRRIAVGAATCLLAACLPLPGGAVLSRRNVAAKGVSELISDDGARCSVSEKTMNETRVGDLHTCVWQGGSPSERQRPKPVLGEKPRKTGR